MSNGLVRCANCPRLSGISSDLYEIMRGYLIEYRALSTAGDAAALNDVGALANGSGGNGT